MIARRITETPRPLQPVRETVPDARGAGGGPGAGQGTRRSVRHGGGVRAGARSGAADRDRTGAPAAAAEPPRPAARPRPYRGRRSSRPAFLRRPLALALGLGFLLGLGVLFGWIRSTAAPSRRARARSSWLAVLPFENLGDASDEYFADGITDEVRGKLATLPGLQVIAGSSAGQYKRSTKSPQQIAQELGVQYLLIGKIRWEKRAGRPEPGAGEPGAGPGGAGRAADHQVAAAVRRLADRRVPGAGRHRGTGGSRARRGAGRRVQQQLAEKPTRNLAAYDAYLKGVEAYSRGGDPRRSARRSATSSRRSRLDTPSRSPGRGCLSRPRS